MSTGPQPKGPRLWLEPERARKGRSPTPSAWTIRDDGGFKRRLPFGPKDRAGAEEALKDYLAEKHAIAPGECSPTQRLTADVLALYARDVVPDHERPEDASPRIERLLIFWAQPAFAMRTMHEQGIKGEPMTGHVADIRTATCKAYYRWGGTKRSGAMDLELLRAAINYSVAEKKLDRPVTPWIPDTDAPRDRWLTRSEAAQIIWKAWRQRRADQAESRWPLINEAIALRARGLSSAGIAQALGVTRNKVAGQLWRHDERTANDTSGLYTTRHIARFALISLYTGKRKAAALAGAFSRQRGFGYIDLQNGLWYPQQGKRQTKKRQPAQPIPAPLLSHLRRWKQNGQSFAVEFHGDPIERLDKAFRALVRECGFDDVVIHTLRHTAITWALQEGMTLWDASGYFGVSVEVLERVYGHHSSQHLRDAAAIMGGRNRRRERRQSGDRVSGTN